MLQTIKPCPGITRRDLGQEPAREDLGKLLPEGCAGTGRPFVTGIHMEKKGGGAA